MKRLFCKNGILLIVTFLFIFSGALNSIGQVNVLDKPVTIDVSKKSFKKILIELQDLTKTNFSYSDNSLPEYKFQHLNFHQIPLKEILNTLLAPFSLDYNIVDNQVVIFPKKEIDWYTVSGFIGEIGSKENMIGATIYAPEAEIGSVTNAYGYYSIKLPQGIYNLQIACLGYENTNLELFVTKNQRRDIFLHPKTYDVTEVLVSVRKQDEFIESALNSLTKIDINALQDMPGLFGENDAMRNLSLMPGIQSNELSTGNLYVRGGSTDQTLYLMDEAILYNAAHFGGFFSVFNPDVVNTVNVYKSDLPLSESGALSSLIDVRLREGNKKQWHLNGGIGLVSLRGSVEGPLIKDRASVLLAFRRTYIDQVLRLMATDPATKNLRFYFYDGNIKANFRLNKNNRFYISGYSGTDSYNQWNRISRTNDLLSLRWNHIFSNRLFSNTSIILGRNRFKQSLIQNQEDILWQSQNNNFKFKYDFTHYISQKFKLTYGYSGNFYFLRPFALYTDLENPIITEVKSEIEQQMQNSFYFQQRAYIARRMYLEAGARITHIFGEQLNKQKDFDRLLFEPTGSISLKHNEQVLSKFSYSRKTQPLHQLLLGTVGVTINRWMLANSDFLPQISNNYSLGHFHHINNKLNVTGELYYRQMSNLIETMQEMQILYAENPGEFLYRSSGKAYGLELSGNYSTSKYRGQINYEFSRVLWTTNGLNDNKPYPATHSRTHSFSFSNVFKLGRHVTASATWQIASGNPFTAATGKYVVDGRTYLKFDKNKINTQHLPYYHRLDISIDVEGKNNSKNRYKSYWNFSVYNAYMHKNVLGVVYFAPVKDDQPLESQVLNPSYFYLYQFVPSISYRFKF